MLERVQFSWIVPYLHVIISCLGWYIYMSLWQWGIKTKSFHRFYIPPPRPKKINYNYTFSFNKPELTTANTDLKVGKSILCMIALDVTCERGGGLGNNFWELACKEVSNFWLSCSWEQCDSSCCFSICIWASKFFSLSWNQCNHHSYLEKYTVPYPSISRTCILLQIHKASTIPSSETHGIPNWRHLRYHKFYIWQYIYSRFI